MWQTALAASFGPTLAALVTWYLSRQQVGKVAETINGQHEELKTELVAARAKIDDLHEARLADAQNGNT